MSQADFGRLVGVSQQAVSALVGRGVLDSEGTAGAWLAAYCAGLREQAAGRASAEGGLDLVQERAALARAQRERVELQNEITRGAYAPIDLLTDVLAAASQAAVDRFDAIEAGIARVAPDLPDEVLGVVIAEVRSARNELVKNATSLVERALAGDELPDEEEPAGEEGVGDADDA